jgi:hypothetical protein
MAQPKSDCMAKPVNRPPVLGLDRASARPKQRAVPLERRPHETEYPATIHVHGPVLASPFWPCAVSPQHTAELAAVRAHACESPRASCVYEPAGRGPGTAAPQHSIG